MREPIEEMSSPTSSEEIEYRSKRDNNNANVASNYGSKAANNKQMKQNNILSSDNSDIIS